MSKLYNYNYFRGEEFNVFEKQLMWWNEDALTIQGKLEDLEGRIFSNSSNATQVMTANQNDLNYLYKLAFLNYKARNEEIKMTNNILSRLEQEGIKDRLKDYVKEDLDPFKSDINKYEGNRSVGKIHNIAKLLWYALETKSKANAFDILKTFVDQSPYDGKSGITKKDIENVFLGSEKFKQYAYNDVYGYMSLVEGSYEFVSDAQVQPPPDEIELLLTKKTKNLVLKMLKRIAKQSEDVSYSVAHIKKFFGDFGFALQVSQQLEKKKEIEVPFRDVTSKQMYMVIEGEWYFVESKTNLDEDDTDDVFKEIYQKFPLYAVQGWEPFNEKFLNYADALHISEKKEKWLDISKKLESYIVRWVYVQDSFKIIFKEKGWETIRDERAAKLIDKGLFFNMDDENNITYNFGRVVLQNDEGDKEGDVYEPNFLKLFWEANKPPEAIATNDNINELGKTTASHWVYFRKSLGKKKIALVDQIKDHVTELHDNMSFALDKLSKFLMDEIVVEPAEKEKVLEVYLMSEKKIVYDRNVSVYHDQFNVPEFVKNLDKTGNDNKKALLVFLLGYYTLRKDVENDNDFHEENGYLADRIKKGKNGVLHFMLYESFLNNVFEQKTIAYDAFVNFLHTDAGEKNSDLTKNKIATEYPCWYNTDKYVTAIHDGEFFTLISDDKQTLKKNKFDMSLRGVPWSANYADVADKDYWLAFENYRTMFFYWNTLYYVLTKLTEQLAYELKLENVYQTYLRMYTEDRIAEQLVSDLEYLSVRKIEKFSERERLRIFQSKTKTQIAPLVKELDEEDQKKIDELYTFAILESQKRINKDRSKAKMTDADVDKIIREYVKERTIQILPAYLMDRDVL